MISATLKDGTRVAARGSVYMRPIVALGREDETTFVRAMRWRRYRELSDGRTRMTGAGDACRFPNAAREMEES